MEHVASHNGIIAACGYDRQKQAHLFLWRALASATSSSSRLSFPFSVGLSPQQANYSVQLSEDCLIGIDVKALPTDSELVGFGQYGSKDSITPLKCSVFLWSTRQILLFQLESIDNSSMRLIDAVECGCTQSPSLLVVSEDASHCASVENRQIIIRCTQLRRRQMINCPSEQLPIGSGKGSNEITALAFVQADVKDIIFALDCGIIYCCSIPTGELIFKYHMSNCVGLCLLQPLITDPVSSLTSLQFIVGSRDGKVTFFERIRVNDTCGDAEAPPVCRERGIVDLNKAMRNLPPDISIFGNDSRSGRNSGKTTPTTAATAAVAVATTMIPLSMRILSPIQSADIEATASVVQTYTEIQKQQQLFQLNHNNNGSGLRSNSAISGRDKERHLLRMRHGYILCVAATDGIVYIAVQTMKVIRVFPLPALQLTTATRCCVCSAAIFLHRNSQQLQAQLSEQQQIFSPNSKAKRTSAERNNLLVQKGVTNGKDNSVAGNNSSNRTNNKSVVVRTDAVIPFHVQFGIIILASFSKQSIFLVDEIVIKVSTKDIYPQSASASAASASSAAANEIYTIGEEDYSTITSITSSMDRFSAGCSDISVCDNDSDIYNISNSVYSDNQPLQSAAIPASAVLSSPFKRSGSGSGSGGGGISSPLPAFLSPANSRNNNKDASNMNMNMNTNRHANVNINHMNDMNASYHVDCSVPISLLIRELDAIATDSLLRCTFEAQSCRVQRPTVEDTISTSAGSYSPRSVGSGSSSKARPSSASRTAAATASLSSSSSRTWEAPQVSKSGTVVDKPIVFNASRIRSSGYGQVPNNPLDVLARKRQERLKKERALALERSSSAPRSSSGSVGTRLRKYPMDCGLLSTPAGATGSNVLPAIKGCSYSADASCLAFATNDNNIFTLKLPFVSNSSSNSGNDCSSSDGIFNCYRGHNGVINHVEFSFDKALLLSSSADGTARIYRRGRFDAPAVIFTHSQHSVAGEKEKLHTNISVSDTSVVSSQSLRTHSNTPVVAITPARSSRGSALHHNNPNLSLSTSATAAVAAGAAGAGSAPRNKPFGQSITKASFYYQDKFVALATKSSVALYMYSIPELLAKGSSAAAPQSHTISKKAELSFIPSLGKYDRVHYWKLDAKAVTALSCVNTSPSQFLFAATSDRRLHVLDSNSGSIARLIDCNHDRPVHHIAVPQPTIHTPISNMSLYDVFLTAATDNAVHIWDLRSNSVCGTFRQHVNRREDNIKVNFSPCMRYFSVGSEDKCGRIVDLRKSNEELCRLSPQHKDVVSEVSFNPLFPQCSSVSYDGTCKFFIDPAACDRIY